MAEIIQFIAKPRLVVCIPIDTFQGLKRGYFDSQFRNLDTVFENDKKVSFNIASEASYVYILCRQKLIKNAKKRSFWRLFENLKSTVKQCYQTGHFSIDGNTR